MKTAASQAVTAAKPVLSVYTPKEFKKEAGRPVGWIVENLIPDEGTTLLVGKTKSHKTRFINAVIAARSAKAKTLGGLKVKLGHTILCSLEHGKAMVCEGLVAAAWGQRLKLERLDCHIVRAPFLVGEDNPQVAALIKLAHETSADLVVFDCARRMGTHDDNSSEQIAELLRLLSPLAEKCAVLIIHHLSKKGEVRGSTDWEAGTDSTVFFTKTPKGVRLEAEHHHTGEIEYQFEISDENGALVFTQASLADPVPEEVRQAILKVCKQQPLGIRALRKAVRGLNVKVGRENLKTALLQLQAKTLLEKNPQGRWTVR